ncbi:hypothetical protein JQ609_27905 [Bradyrhizobium sp. AUGA SZCCT0169]|uniref:hypothetical protein n=1 Tax=Bradyrhizobium sp. AUGA SZCCT0169 TaxID=2807663 RepID=UPI001BA83917|nr:hypothetical protein [Bradyrhizobium sp. AUGA SZCCT0169]MBR1250732.1 hypothetical protein [Bradyrhizobium sp. AUGA SZCCT0169]
MFARTGVFSSIGRAGAVATVVALALTAYQPSAAFAGSAAPAKDVTAKTGTSGATDFSSRARRYHGGGGAAAAAAFAGIVGTGIAIAAAQNRRDYYYGNSYGYYGGGPAYYAPPAYYGGGPYYYGGGYGRDRYYGGYKNPNYW